MEWTRSWLGFSQPKRAAPPPTHPLVARHQQQASTQSVHERLQEQLLARRFDVEVEQASVAEAQAQAAKCKTLGNKDTWMYWKRQEAAHKEAEAAAQAKVKLIEDQLSIHEKATGNLQHALILKDGNAELSATMAAMETLQVRDTLDEMKDHARTVEEYDQAFSGRLVRPSMAEMQAELDLDAEWDQEQAQSVGDTLPRVPAAAAGVSAVAPKTSTSDAVVHEK